MAKVFRAPIDPPVFNIDTWEKDETKYLAELVEAAHKNRPDDELVGEVIRWPRGDGYALYMVWSTRPLELVWIEVGDAWSVEDALIRGTTIADVRAKVKMERSRRALFAKKES
jgi:hypothetical protein